MEALGIDLRSLVFQLINFGILLFVLNKLLHKPLKKLMQDRQREIDEGLANAAKAREQLEAAGAERDKLLAEAEVQGRAVLAEVKARAQELEAELTEEAEKRGERLLARTREELAAERNQMKDELRGELAGMVVTATEKVLRSPISDDEKRAQVDALVKEIS